MSTFLAGDRSTDSRKIGTEHWPLKLNVQFYEHSPEEYYAKVEPRAFSSSENAP